MAKTNKLSATKVDGAKKRGMYGDGGGLWLRVTSPEVRSWVMRFTLHGRVREMGLGALSTISLAGAREGANKCRRQLQDGIDPIEAAKAAKIQAKVDRLKSITFRTASEIYIEAHRAGWRNDKHGKQWDSTLSAYAYPVFGDLPVAAIDTGLVMKVLEPIWKTKTETASRLRGRIEAVLNLAKVREYRTGENPARWRGHLENLLPKRGKVQRVTHHAALPYAEIGGFMASLRAQEGIAARALEFTILTAARTGEAIGARLEEIDAAGVWTVPAERMKAGKAHRVPLAAAALAIVEQARKRGDTYLFPGMKRGRPISNMAMLATLSRMGRDDLTTHGFRSTFRDWAAEQSSFPSDVAEMALAHAVGDKVEQAYRRGDMLEKRRQLAEAWARYCGTPAKGGKVVSIRGAKA